MNKTELVYAKQGYAMVTDWDVYQRVVQLIAKMMRSRYEVKEDNKKKA